MQKTFTLLAAAEILFVFSTNQPPHPPQWILLSLFSPASLFSPFLHLRQVLWACGCLVWVKLYYTSGHWHYQNRNMHIYMHTHWHACVGRWYLKFKKSVRLLISEMYVGKIGFKFGFEGVKGFCICDIWREEVPWLSGAWAFSCNYFWHFEGDLTNPGLHCFRIIVPSSSFPSVLWYLFPLWQTPFWELPIFFLRLLLFSYDMWFHSLMSLTTKQPTESSFNKYCERQILCFNVHPFGIMA